MKRMLFIPVLLLFLFGCNTCPDDSKQKDERTMIENQLEKFVIAIENEDYLMIENIWEEGDSTMLLGTDSHERLMGWKNIRNAYRKQFDLISETYISVHDQFIRVNCTGNTAWFSQRMNYNFIYDSVAQSFEGLRFTGVMIKDDNNDWKMVQAHLSLPGQINIGK